jgi:hypothetical protein
MEPEGAEQAENKFMGALTKSQGILFWKSHAAQDAPGDALHFWKNGRLPFIVHQPGSVIKTCQLGLSRNIRPCLVRMPGQQHTVRAEE